MIYGCSMISSVGGSWNGLLWRILSFLVGRDAPSSYCIKCRPFHWRGGNSAVIQVWFSLKSSFAIICFFVAMHCTWRPEAARKCFARRVNWVCWRRGPLLTSSWSTWTVSKLSFNIPFPWNHQPWDKVRLLASTHMYTQSYRSWEHAVIWTRVSGGHRPQVCLSIRRQKHKGGVG